MTAKIHPFVCRLCMVKIRLSAGRDKQEGLKQLRAILKALDAHFTTQPRRVGQILGPCWI
jgi:hypothetical protein